MENTKFSDLDPVTAVASPDFVAVVQGGVSKRADVSLFNDLKATLILRCSGDNDDSSTVNGANSGIKQVDVNNVEMFRVWTDGTFGGNVLIVDKIPTGFEFGNATDNVLIGTQIGVNFTDASSNVAIGNSALQEITEGQSNTAIGTASGFAITDGNENLFIGYNASSTEASASNVVVIGNSAKAAAGVTANAIALGDTVIVATDNTAVIGNADITDVYFGSVTGAAKLHGKGDAIVFPDSDPHIVGAGYWLAGVLTRSSG